MTAKDKVARRKLSLLELAQGLGNASKACKVMGYIRQQFYQILRNRQIYGSEGHLDRLPGSKGPHPDRVPEEIEQAILQHALDHPTHGCTRVSHELALQGVNVSSMGVRGVWSRHALQTKHERLLRLEKTMGEESLELTEEQIEALERFNPEFRERHIETRGVGDPVAVDTFYVGTLRGMGKVYMQTALDCRSRYAFGRLYTSKPPITAVHMLNDAVLPFFEERGARVVAVLSDNGREYCGRADQHPYQLFLQLEDVRHQTTRVGRQQSNGFIERFHRTVLDEHFRIVGRKKWYESLEEMQADLGNYLETYNTKQPHQGYNMNGRTPEQAFLDDLKKEEERAAKEEA